MGLLTDFRLTVLEQNLGVYGVCVYQNCKVIAEHRFRNDDRENLYSGSKTFVSVAIGIAEFEEILSIEDYVINYFPEYSEIASADTEKIKIEHLLMMASGHLEEYHSKYNDMDRTELFFSTDVKVEPGTKFFYEDLSTYMLGRIIEKISGVSLLEYMKPRLFDKLDICNPQWHNCQLGHTSCSGGLFLKTEEFSRIGILLLNKGKYESKRILSSDFIERMHSKLIDTSFKLDSESQQGYGYQVWKCTLPNSYSGLLSRKRTS